MGSNPTSGKLFSALSEFSLFLTNSNRKFLANRLPCRSFFAIRVIRMSYQKILKYEYAEKQLIPPGLEPGTLRVLGARDNHYTTGSWTKRDLGAEVLVPWPLICQDE